MKALVIFDSNLGNTKLIAETIAKELGEETKAVSVSDFNIGNLAGIELLVVGSPIIGWRPSERMQHFLATLGKDQLKGIKATSFDTRVKLFIHGDAAKEISEKLKQAGAEIVFKPEVFYVKGKEGPLFDGEIDKAIAWARSLITK